MATPDPLDGYDDDDTLSISDIVRLTGANPRAVVRAGQEGLLDLKTAPGEVGRATVRSVREHRATLVNQEERITLHLPVEQEER